MAKIKLTKNEQKAQKDALKMYQRYLPTLTLKKQQLQSEIRTIDEKCKAVREEKKALEEDFQKWISVFGEKDAFKPDMVTVRNIKKGWSNIAGVKIPIYEGADLAVETTTSIRPPCGLIWLQTEWSGNLSWIWKPRFWRSR